MNIKYDDRMSFSKCLLLTDIEDVYYVKKHFSLVSGRDFRLHDDVTHYKNILLGFEI